MTNIYGFTQEKLGDWFAAQGENRAKAGITFDGIYRGKITDFAALGFSERVTEKMRQGLVMELPEVAERLESEDAAKLLLRLSDGEYAETVLMRQRFGNFVCVSTQVGCSMGCAFCQSGRMKKRRNLSVGEIVGQVLCIEREFGIKVHGVSVMGIGEPFDNYEATSDFCDIICAGKGLQIGERHVTVSTCGIVPKITDFMNRARPCNLAISLHAPNDELREKLMPINRAYKLDELMKAAAEFTRKTNRRVTLEYIMLNEVNDFPEHAEQLAALVGDNDFYVNIIPYNATDSGFTQSTRERIVRFYDILKKRGLVVTTRREFGSGLKAACGQLRADYEKQYASEEND